MSHNTLTCENHPHLRWSCKTQAISYDKDGNGRYNGTRSIFFKGQYDPSVDAHGWDKCHQVVRDVLVQECACSSRKLILLPAVPANATA